MFNAAHNKTICLFDLTVCLWVIDGGIIELNAQVNTPGFHFIGCKIGAVIGDDVVWDTIMVHDTGYKVYHWSSFSRFDWFGFYPLSELVDHN